MHLTWVLFGGAQGEANQGDDVVLLLLQAAKGGHTEICRHAVAPGPSGGVAVRDCNCVGSACGLHISSGGGGQVSIDSEDEWGNTALILAALAGHVRAPMLLQAYTSYTVCPLFSLGGAYGLRTLQEGGPRHGQLETAEALLELGANPNKQNVWAVRVSQPP